MTLDDEAALTWLLGTAAALADYHQAAEDHARDHQ